MLSYAVLRDIQKREMESSALVNLEDGFYADIAELLAKTKQDAMGGDSMLPLREYENIKKIVRGIQAKREEKIVLLAIRAESSGAGLTAEEKDMLEELRSTIDKSRGRLLSVWGKEKKPSEQKRVKLLQNVEEYKGLDNKLYGPFKEGEEQTLPGGEAEWLMNAGMAEPA